MLISLCNLFIDKPGAFAVGLFYSLVVVLKCLDTVLVFTASCFAKLLYALGSVRLCPYICNVQDQTSLVHFFFYLGQFEMAFKQ